ncbi:DUF2897 family protein [Thalassotalea marina]|uniref:DUF2897 family protein n=1 Tax=Thalassotalea marina TaxID=1673741 RepID=A0A919EGX4_9GAMM|nr:DUF2897 family protein [Thalassotalea marina]GHF81476.1 hypothetical protein GCM10017161_06140 [Thalassotalea marina]
MATYLIIGLVIIVIVGALLHILSTAKKFKLDESQLKKIKQREREQKIKDQQFKK